MKVQNIQSGPQNLQKSASPQPNGEAGSFQRLLQGRIEALAKAEGIKAPRAAESGVQPSPELRLEGLSLTETTLATLDRYGAALETLSYNTEELEPFVSALEEETAALLDLKQELPPEDPLARLLDRVATMSYLESAKYRRGDYSS